MSTNRSGSILITASWIMAIVTLLALGIGFRSSIDMRLNKYSLDALKARQLANAGIVKARELIRKDATANVDTLYECGITLNADTTPASVFAAANNALGDGSFAVSGIVDEERKININIDMIPLVDKPGEYRRILKGLSANMTDEVIDSMIDWQDTDLITPSGEPEEEYYGALEHPYKCKNAPFECLEELLAVKGMTQALYDEIKDRITVYSNGRININTASREVLSAVMNDAGGPYPLLVENIINRRSGADGIECTADDVPFFGIDDMMSCAVEENEKNRVTQVAPYIVFASSDFTISAHGYTGRLKKDVTYVIDRGGITGEQKVKFYHEE